MSQIEKGRSYKDVLKIQGIIFGVLLIGFLVVFIVAGYSNTEEHSVSFDWTIDSEMDQTIYAKVTPKNGWLSNSMYGNEYDGVLVNNTKHVIRDWSVVVQIENGSYIDSSWNGTWSIEGSLLCYTPAEFNETVLKGEEKTFGLVLYSNDKLKMNEVELRYHENVTPTQYPLFWILVLLALANFFVLAFETSVHAKMQRYESKHSAYKSLVNEALRTIANIIDTKDEYTKGHSLRVAIYSRQIAERMGLPDYEQERIYYIGLLHDIGKIGIPTTILTKPGRLNDEEFEVIKKHPQLGAAIVKDFKSIKGAANGVKYHHERYDGKGYNMGLKGDEIPLEGRIICVADSYDAMSSRRCYRDSLSYEYIMGELKKNSGTQFDPDIVKYMIEMIEGGYAPVSDAEMRAYEI